MPIQVTICRGPTCSRMSSHAILAVAQSLARRHPGLLQIEVQHCFARCQQNQPGLCPSVCINNEWLHDTDEIQVKRRLRKLLEEREAEFNGPDDPFRQMLNDD